MLTTVRVRDVAVQADIGVNPDEIGRRQPLIVSIDLVLHAVGEDLASSIDYRRAVAVAERLADERTPLIETYAARLAAECGGWDRVAKVRIVVEKPQALRNGVAGVIVET